MSANIENVVKAVVATLNARAVVTVTQRGDTVIVVAANRAAANTLRAFASLIRYRIFAFPEVYYVGYGRRFT